MNEKIVIERTYQAKLQELWDLWTTKAGFESWWGPEGCRVEVHELEARKGGTIQYDMIADAPEQIEGTKKLGLPISNRTRGRFSEFNPHTRLALTHVMDFIPGVASYESTMAVDFIPAGDRVRMVVTIQPMHDEDWTKLAAMGFTSQLTKLDKRFG